MKKKIILLIIFLFVGFIALNYKTFLAYYYNSVGNKFYQNEEYISSMVSHMKASSLLDKDDFIYNIGNDYFHVGQEQTNTGGQLAYYNLSLESYLKLLEKDDLNIELRSKVIKNAEIVKKKIEELTQNKSDTKAQKQNTDDTENGDKEEKTSETGEQNNSESMTGEENNTDTEIPKYEDLLPAEKKQIDTYIENLKSQEEQNMQFFNQKNTSENNIKDVFFNRFSNDSFFDDMFDRGGEKDW